MYYNSYDTTFYYLFTTIYCILTAIYCCYYFLLQFTIFYCKLPHFYRKLPHRWSKFKKKKLPKITTIYCNFTAIYNNNLLHLVVLQLYFLLFFDIEIPIIFYFDILQFTALSLQFTALLPQFTAFTIFYCSLLQVTAIYRDLPPKWDHSVVTEKIPPLFGVLSKCHNTP